MLFFEEGIVEDQGAEYLALSVQNGVTVLSVSPRTAHTDSAKSRTNNFGDLGPVLNKLAEYDYELLPFVVPGNNPSYCTLILKRLK